jgi:hypothetical protein
MTGACFEFVGPAGQAKSIARVSDAHTLDNDCSIGNAE